MIPAIGSQHSVQPTETNMNTIGGSSCCDDSRNGLGGRVSGDEVSAGAGRCAGYSRSRLAASFHAV